MVLKEGEKVFFLWKVHVLNVNIQIVNALKANKITMGCINAKKRRKEAFRQGLNISSSKRKTYLKTNEDSANGSPAHVREPAPPIPLLTERQKELIMQSWQKIQEDMSKVGVVMFMR